MPTIPSKEIDYLQFQQNKVFLMIYDSTDPEGIGREVYKAVPEKVLVNGDGDINGEYIDVKVVVNLLDK